MPNCLGSFRALLLYDIAEEIDLVELSRLLGAEPPVRSPGFKLAAPVYVRFERAPMVVPCEQNQSRPGEPAHARLRYFDYGVVSLEIELQFQGEWHELIALS